MWWDGASWQQWNAGTCTRVAAAADGSATVVNDCGDVYSSGEQWGDAVLLPVRGGAGPECLSLCCAPESATACIPDWLGACLCPCACSLRPLGGCGGCQPSTRRCPGPGCAAAVPCFLPQAAVPGCRAAVLPCCLPDPPPAGRCVCDSALCLPIHSSCLQMARCMCWMAAARLAPACAGCAATAAGARTLA